MKNKATRHNHHYFIIDLIALVAYLLAANPGITGLLIHEYVSLALLVVVLVHTIQHYDWIIDRIFRRKPSKPLQWVNLALDILTALDFMACMVSGIFVSRYVLPAIGLVAPGYFFWYPLLSITAKLLLATIIALLALHFRWIVATISVPFKHRKKQTGENDQQQL
jgi:hypothetical protein